MRNTFGLNRSLGGAIALIALVSVLGWGVVIVALHRLNAATELRNRSGRAVHALDAFRTAMLNQETGLRGYLITDREGSLEPYRAGRRALETATADLRRLLGDDPVQAGRLSEAVASARAWQRDVGERAVAEMVDPSTRGDAVAIESSGTGKLYLDAVREKLKAIEDGEQRIVDAQNKVLIRSRDLVNGASWAAAIATLCICALVAFGINRLIVKPLTALAEVMGRLAQRDLDVPVPGTGRRNEVGGMARAVQVFKEGMIQLDRSSLLHVTADTLPAMVGYVDARRRVGFLNNEFARWFDLGVDDVSEMRGRPLAEAFAGDGFPGAGKELEAAFGGAEARFEHRFARRGSGRRDLEAFYRPHRGPTGAVLGVVTLLTDITERRRMERGLAKHARDLRRSNEELEQFVYVASHDLRAPLRGIENLVGWIEEDLEGSLTGDVKTNMDLLKSRVRRLESLLDDLLAYSRAGRGGEAQAETVDTRRLVEDVAALASPPESFSVEGSPTLPTLQAPRAPLTQIVQNLIGNAIKHHDHHAGGHVWIEAKASAEATEFAVSDDGPGVPVQFRDRVFGMFQTLRPRDEVEGSGMGFAIVKKLVERHDGRIWLADREGGRGLAVHFTWPRTKGEADGADG